MAGCVAALVVLTGMTWPALATPLTLACAEEVAPTLSGRYQLGADGRQPPADQLVEMGRRIFFDPGLSASGKVSCASCHSPTHAYGSPNRLTTQPGGPLLDRVGLRNTPPLRYLHAPFAFTEHYIDLLDNNGQDSGPAGGRTWDGRVDQGREQALMPLLDPSEMANKNVDEVVGRLRQAPYASAFRKLFSLPGTNVLDDVDASINWLMSAIEFFEQSPEDFHPFSSKYDAYLRGQASLSAPEKRGLRLFNDKEKGNCAACHPSVASSSTVIFPRFTDFEYSALGAPRNKALAQNRDPSFHDLGLCGPFRTDLKETHPEYCGRFRAPTLRNVALKSRFFHNGVFGSLKEVLDFYVTRDTDPARWYGRDARGRAGKFNDLPKQYHGNVNTDAPFKPLHGNRPRLTARDIQDVIAFLNTLSDRDVEPAAAVPSSRHKPSACCAPTTERPQ